VFFDDESPENTGPSRDYCAYPVLRTKKDLAGER